MAEIRLEGVTKLFKQVRAVDDVSLTISEGEFMVLLGPSGCGKTTLLRSVAGLEQIDAGRVLIGGRDVTYLPPRKRNIAMVFQSYAVFPHMTVFDNIAFGLRMRKASRAEIRRRVQEAAELLHIEGLLDRYPSQTSGGQRQRIAVARALAMQPQVLLMDEPLSNLDALLRLEARAELKRLLSEIGSTTIYVTHDQVEAMSMGDRVAVMRAGKLVQVDEPLAIYDRPADRFVGGFIGNPPMNFLPVTVSQRDGAAVATVADAGEVRVDARDGLAGRSGPLLLGIRAENIEIAPLRGGEALHGRVLVVEPLGSHNLVTLRVGGELLKAITRPDEHLDPDQEVAITIDSERIRWLDARSEVALAHDVHAGPGAGMGGVTSAELEGAGDQVERSLE
ncbi:MAG TPA: ABC transporter ATP-binding protein [candidate division Zixibacteria bacterium]|nr:ABC transporter ATP-binding protein [candidate division Zixibacteria bacterium]